MTVPWSFSLCAHVACAPMQCNITIVNRGSFYLKARHSLTEGVPECLFLHIIEIVQQRFRRLVNIYMKCVIIVHLIMHSCKLNHLIITQV